MSETLTNKYDFYHQYHLNPWNKLTHIITVPIISLTLAAILSSLSPLLTSSVLVTYSLYYLSLDLGYGLIWILTNGLPVYFFHSYLIAFFTLSQLFQLHLLAWVIQVVIGHLVFEGNRPAFLTGLKDSFTIAPLFVMFETWELFFLLHRFFD